jgi:hypothetical protein
MSAGMVIDVRPYLQDESPVRVVDGEDLQSRYDQLLALVMRMGGWLTGPQAQLLPQEAWEAQFARYQEHLDQLRRLGDELRPTSLRERGEMLTGDALTAEIAELFAA